MAIFKICALAVGIGCALLAAMYDLPMGMTLRVRMEALNSTAWGGSRPLHESFACDCLQLHEIENAYERVCGPIGAKSYGVNSETIWPGTGC
jgi:hypothetical protein